MSDASRDADHDTESVGSLAQETARLLHAMAAEARRPAGEEADDTGTASVHVCTTGWCPICNVVGYIHDHPEVVEQVTEAAMELGRTVREAIARTLPPDQA